MEIERNDREPAAGDGPASRQHDMYSGPGAVGAGEVARVTDQQAMSIGEVAGLVDRTVWGAQMSLINAPDGALAEPTQIFKFKLGEERYCVILDTVIEIIDRIPARPLPDSPPYVIGAMDYRGATTESTIPYSPEYSREPPGR